MRALLARTALLSVVVLVACGGQPPRPVAPRPMVQLSAALAAAFQEEAIGSPEKAIDLYVRALDSAASAPADPASVPVALASLDALVFRSAFGFDGSRSTALVDRVPPARLGNDSVDARLAKVASKARGPFLPALVAEARLALAERRSDASAAGALRAQTGCIQEAALVGPVDFANVAGVATADALTPAYAPLPAEVPGPGPFLRKVAPTPVRAMGCNLPLHAQSAVSGVREVVVDVEVPGPGPIGVSLSAPSAATLFAGGLPAVERPLAAGAGTVTRFARVEVEKKGTLRLVAKVGQESDYATVRIGAWDAAGKPLRARPPAVGQRATTRATRVAALGSAEPSDDDARLAFSLGALAAEDTRRAEGLLHVAVARPDAKPALLLAYGRAVRLARDLPNVKTAERARAAYERVLETWPASWEAIVEHSLLAGARRGQAEANLEVLGALAEIRARAKGVKVPAVLDAFEAHVAGREDLHDRAQAAFGRAEGALAGTALLEDVSRVAFQRSGAEAVAFECNARSPADRATLACYRARLGVGDREGAEKELERLRALSGSSQLYLSLSSRSALEVGDVARAGALLDRMNPGDRTLSSAFAVAFAAKGKAAAADLLARAPEARDAPQTLAGILRASGDDPLATFEGVAERVTAQAQDQGALAGAATVVLAHDERYDVAPNGLVHFLMLDVRRVMGTTDVDANAQADAPMIYGRDNTRVLRRRIFKKDGRVVLPDQTPMAAQSHADLSQLEAGDAVEAIYEGWGIPAETGHVGIDTPDLLPERTTVRDGRIELRLPADLKGALWAHDLLGKPVEKTEGNKRVLEWRMRNRRVRRLEVGVPKMDRNVGISFSTATWADVARQTRDSVLALDSDDPELTAWARDHASGKQGQELVAAIVAASGDAVKEASGMVLADVDVGRPAGGATQTARTSLVTHEGSRTWVVVKALRELGVPVDIVVAENEPFSNSPEFPPHYGRFMHPLAVAHVPGADVWIDADVPGPPLPAGRISPELRGRNALFPDGRIAPLPQSAFGERERDEIDIRLALDAQGNAKGSLTVLLRGRAAQDIAEALVRIVGLERQRALRGIALAWVPMATVEKVELSSSEGSWQVAMRAELSIPGYAQIVGSKGPSRAWVLPGLDPIHYVYPRPYVTTLGSTYASHGAREDALAINRATQYHVRRRVELPAKARVARLPGPFEGKGPLLSAQRKVAVSGNTIEEDFTLDVTTGTVAREGYDTFVGEAHRADDAFRASTRVLPPSP